MPSNLLVSTGARNRKWCLGGGAFRAITGRETVADPQLGEPRSPLYLRLCLGEQHASLDSNSCSRVLFV